MSETKTRLSIDQHVNSRHNRREWTWHVLHAYIKTRRNLVTNSKYYLPAAAPESCFQMPYVVLPYCSWCPVWRITQSAVCGSAPTAAEAAAAASALAVDTTTIRCIKTDRTSAQLHAASQRWHWCNTCKPPLQPLQPRHSWRVSEGIFSLFLFPVVRLTALWGADRMMAVKCQCYRYKLYFQRRQSLRQREKIIGTCAGRSIISRVAILLWNMTAIMSR